MKKAIIVSGVVVAALIGGFLIYRTFFANSFSSVNINIGAVDEKVAGELCQGKGGHSRLVCLADELKKTVNGDLLSNLQREYTISDAQKWSNFPPIGLSKLHRTDGWSI